MMGCGGSSCARPASQSSALQWAAFGTFSEHSTSCSFRVFLNHKLGWGAMKVVETVDAAHVHVLERTAKSVLVPTMGALHRGHLELIQVAREHAGKDGEVAVSIFVNPLQFEPGSDFEKYPRPESADEKFCAHAGVDLLFRPREMYS